MTNVVVFLIGLILGTVWGRKVLRGVVILSAGLVGLELKEKK